MNLNKDVFTPKKNPKMQNYNLKTTIRTRKDSLSAFCDQSPKKAICFLDDMGEKKTPNYCSPSPEERKNSNLLRVSRIMSTYSKKNEISFLKNVQKGFQTDLIKSNGKMNLSGKKRSFKSRDNLKKTLSMFGVSTTKRSFPLEKLKKLKSNPKFKRIKKSSAIYSKNYEFINKNLEKLNKKNGAIIPNIFNPFSNSLKKNVKIANKISDYKTPIPKPQIKKIKCPSIKRVRDNTLRERKIQLLLQKENKRSLNKMEKLIRLDLPREIDFHEKGENLGTKEGTEKKEKAGFFKFENFFGLNTPEDKKVPIQMVKPLVENTNVISYSKNHLKDFDAKFFLDFLNPSRKNEDQLGNKKIDFEKVENPFDQIFISPIPKLSENKMIKKTFLNPNVVTYENKSSELFF